MDMSDVKKDTSRVQHNFEMSIFSARYIDIFDIWIFLCRILLYPTFSSFSSNLIVWSYDIRNTSRGMIYQLI